jgi:hypothetical protein
MKGFVNFPTAQPSARPAPAGLRTAIAHPRPAQASDAVTVRRRLNLTSVYAASAYAQGRGAAAPGAQTRLNRIA